MRILRKTTENPKNPFDRNSHLNIYRFCEPYWRAVKLTLARSWANLLADEMRDFSRKGEKKM